MLIGTWLTSDGSTTLRPSDTWPRGALQTGAHRMPADAGLAPWMPRTGSFVSTTLQGAEVQGWGRPPSLAVRSRATSR